MNALMNTLKNLALRLLTAILFVYHHYFGPSFRWSEFVRAIALAYGVGFSFGEKMKLHGNKSHEIGLLVAVIGALFYIRNPKDLPWIDLSTASTAITAVAAIPPVSPQGEGAAEETQDQATDQTGEQSDGSASS